MVVAEVGEGRLGAARTPSAVRAETDRKMRVEAGAGAGCECGCRCRSRCRRRSRESSVGVDVGVDVGVGIGDGVVVARDWSKGEAEVSECECGVGGDELE